MFYIRIIKRKKKDEKLKERLFNTYNFSNHNINKFNLLFQKGVYPYDNMDHWEKVSETSIPEKEDFYSHLDDIIDADYKQGRRVCKNSEIRNFREYHDLYVQSDTLLSPEVFENFRNMCLEI